MKASVGNTDPGMGIEQDFSHSIYSLRLYQFSYGFSFGKKETGSLAATVKLSSYSEQDKSLSNVTLHTQQCDLKKSTATVGDVICPDWNRSGNRLQRWQMIPRN